MFSLNDRVKVLLPQDNWVGNRLHTTMEYVPGTVTDVTVDGLYTVALDDGFTLPWVQPSLMRTPFDAAR
jgi:hypothetical protein